MANLKKIEYKIQFYNELSNAQLNYKAEMTLPHACLMRLKLNLSSYEVSLTKLTLCIFSVGNTAVNKAKRLGMCKNKCSWMTAGTSVFSATNKAEDLGKRLTAE